MLPYLSIASMPLVFSIPFRGLKSENEAVKRQNRIALVAIIGVVLFLFLAFRNKLLGSTDTLNYYNMMLRAIAVDSWGDYYSSDGVETGFQLFVFLLSRVFKDPQAIIIASSAIIVFCISFFVYKNCDDIAFGMTMYISLGLMVFQMQGMRQAMAMSICLLAFELVKKHKIISFVLLVLFAMCFHRTAIVFLVVYVVSYVSYSWQGITLISFASGLVFLLSDYIIDVANVIFESEYGSEANHGGIVATAIYVLIIVFSIFFYKKLKTDRLGSTIFYVTIIGFVCYLLRYVGALAAERISFYFMFAQIALLTNALAEMDARERVMIKTIVYVLMVALFTYRLNGSDLVPYSLFFV